MELAQKIRFNAPAWRVLSVEVDMRRFSDWNPVIDPSLPPEAYPPHLLRPETDPLFQGRAEKNLGGEREPDISAVEALATCAPTIEGVTSFLYQFGPLFGPGEDGSFAVSLAGFISVRGKFRLAWDHALGLPPKDKRYRKMELDLVGNPQAWRYVSISGVIEYRSTGLIHCTDSLYAALVFKLFALAQRKKLRRCPKPRCTGRTYFIATHPKDRYCSDACKQWAQAKAKRDWWVESGDAWRKERASKSSSETGGNQ